MCALLKDTVHCWLLSTLLRHGERIGKGSYSCTMQQSLDFGDAGSYSQVGLHIYRCGCAFLVLWKHWNTQFEDFLVA